MSGDPFLPQVDDPFDRTDVDLRRLPYRDARRERRSAALLASGDPVRVYLDDLREPARGARRWVVVRTAYEAIAVLRTHEVAELSLDFDLGVAGLRAEGVPEDVLALVGEGGDVTRWLERQLLGHGRDRVPAELNIHSANAVGARAMGDAIRSLGRVVAFGEVVPGRTWRRS